jgi:hypothetical protein
MVIGGSPTNLSSLAAPFNSAYPRSFLQQTAAPSAGSLQPSPVVPVSTPGAQSAVSAVAEHSEKDKAVLMSYPKNMMLLYTPADDWKLSPYQCLARKQLELFEASEKDLEAGAQGRNRPIMLGQVGIRCRWCSSQPSRQRQRASSYYPSKLEGIYQAAQNITNSHLSRLCQSVPPVIREELVRLQAKKSGAGGGKKYWSQSAKEQGIYDVDDVGLRLGSPSKTQSTDQTPNNAKTADIASHSGPALN